MVGLAIVSELPQAESDETCATFDDFRTLYPRRIAMKDARRAWDRMTPDNRVAALVALVDWRRVWLKRGEPEFIPYPATWLNGERWEDELPAEVRQSHASHVAATSADAPVTRGAIPEHVRALLAKLRGGK